MITSVDADLNILGNPQIYKNISGNEISIARSATNVNIIITPIAGYNASNTNTANGGVIASLSGLGLVVTCNVSTISITGSSLVASVLATYNLLIKNGANTTIDTESIQVEILDPVFAITQQACNYCTRFNPTEANTTSQNPPIANRGKIDYYHIDALGVESLKVSGSYADTIEYCWCGAATDLIMYGILTIRQIPNCGGTSPIIFQAIGNQVEIDVTEYKPEGEFSGEFSCCVSEDSTIEIEPISITNNNSSPHNCSNPVTLKYDLYKNNAGTYEEVLLLIAKTGTLALTSSSKNVVGTSTLFTTELIIGSKLYLPTGELLGVVETITDNTHLSLVDESLDTASGLSFESNEFYFNSPSTSSIFEYEDLEKGTYRVIATLTNCCATFIKTWDISICNSYIIEVGTCNNPTFQNISGLNYLMLTIKTYNTLDIIDNVSQTEIVKDLLISPLSEYSPPKLDDGFYQIITSVLDDTGEVLSTQSQVALYDCNIKSCEIYLRRALLGFSFCSDCSERATQEKQYNNLKIKNYNFTINKDILYSYWNDLKEQQSIPSSWDIEDHLQDLATYTEVLNTLKSICATCGFSYTNNSTILTPSTDCGCNK